MCQVNVGPERVRGLRMCLVRGGKDAFPGRSAPSQSFSKVPTLTRDNITTLSHSLSLSLIHLDEVKWSLNGV